MRILTVRQPWAWAIVHGEKDVENRTQSWKYRGPIAIHAANQTSEQGMRDDNVRAAWSEHGEGDPLEALVIGAVIGVVDLVDVHTCATDCCSSPWAMQDLVVETWRGPLSQTRSQFRVHLVLANPRPLAKPIPAKGRLGLWRPDEQLTAAIREQVSF